MKYIPTYAGLSICPCTHENTELRRPSSTVSSQSALAPRQPVGYLHGLHDVVALLQYSDWLLLHYKHSFERASENRSVFGSTTVRGVAVVAMIINEYIIGRRYKTDGVSTKLKVRFKIGGSTARSWGWL
ncbi:unnamed protein product [Scytosiphon promiscuus]